MNISKLTKAGLISELEKRSLPTNGLKDDLLRRLKEAIEKESISEMENQEENYDSEDDNVEIVSEDKAVSNQDSDSSDKLNETVNDDEIVKEINSTEITADLTVDDTINMKSTADAENYSMIVNVNDDDNSMPNSINDQTVDYERTSGSRDIDNGEHEVIEISEEVIIDDEENQENDNNYNEELFHNDQTQQDKDELESGESREEEVAVVKEKITLWIHNIAEDVKAVELKELFGKFGKVTSAKVVMNGKDATGNCFGCIELCNNDDAESCIKNLDKTEFRGNIITISKNICDLTPKETIQRNISPISSNDSWGGDGKNREKSKSLSPFICEPIANNDDKEEEKEQSNEKFSTPYRGRGGYRGNNYRGKNYVPRDDGQDSRGRQNDYRRGGEGRSNYGSRPDRYGDESVRHSGDTRPRDSYQRRDVRGGHDDYRGSKADDSRYPPMSRDRYSSRDGYNDRSSRRYEDDGRSGGPPRYSNYDSQSYYDRHGDKRPYNDRPRDSDYSSSRREAEVPFKRPRIDTDDYYAPKSRRRDDYSPDRCAVAPRDRYRAPSPKRSFYYSDKDSSYHHRSSSRDKRDVAYSRASPVDSSRRPGDHQYPGSRRAPVTDYGRAAHAPYSPPGDRPRPARSHNYSKESYPTDFGGRSRNYDR